MNTEALKQVLDAIKLHTAETHPLVETERAMEAIEAELSQPQFMRMPKHGDRVIFTEGGIEGTVLLISPSGGPYIKFDDGTDGQWSLYEFGEMFHYADNTLQRQPQTMRPAELAERLKRGEKWAVGLERQPLTTDEYVQALGPLLSQIVCSSGTLRCIVRTIEAQHDIKEQP